VSTAAAALPVVAHCGFRRARQIAGIMIPTTNIIIRNNGIFQNHVTGVIAAIAIPNPIMQTRDAASLPPLMRNAFFSVRGVRWRAWDSSSAMQSVPLCYAERKAQHELLAIPVETLDARLAARIISRLAGCVAGLSRHHRAHASAMQAGVRASLFRRGSSLSRRRPDDCRCRR
jgi:hypothetical protein